jgi:hypothetical protein
MALVFLALKSMGKCLAFKFLIVLSTFLTASSPWLVLTLNLSITLLFLFWLMTVKTLAIDLLRPLILAILATAVPDALVNLIVCNSSYCYCYIYS